jgi:hypothetical protein
MYSAVAHSVNVTRPEQRADSDSTDEFYVRCRRRACACGDTARWLVVPEGGESADMLLSGRHCKHAERFYMKRGRRVVNSQSQKLCCV